MRYSVERRDGTWFEHELNSREDSESAAVIAGVHSSSHIELSWRDKEGRAATRVIYRIVHDSDGHLKIRTLSSLTNEIERIRLHSEEFGE